MQLIFGTPRQRLMEIFKLKIKVSKVIAVKAYASLLW
jgi:hypothetical protein